MKSFSKSPLCLVRNNGETILQKLGRLKSALTSGKGIPASQLEKAFNDIDDIVGDMEYLLQHGEEAYLELTPTKDLRRVIDELGQENERLGQENEQLAHEIGILEKVMKAF